MPAWGQYRRRAPAREEPRGRSRYGEPRVIGDAEEQASIRPEIHGSPRVSRSARPLSPDQVGTAPGAPWGTPPLPADVDPGVYWQAAVNTSHRVEPTLVSAHS